MRTIFEPARADVVAPTRIVLLPPAYASPEDFIREGFVAAVHERDANIDLVLVELKLPQLLDRRMLRRLRHEIVLPARALGSRAVWLAGLSLGGFVALTYAERYPHEVDGLCLLAPYLGNHIVTDEIERADGLKGWQPGELAEDDDERRVWRFIRTQALLPQTPGEQTPAWHLALHLGFGSEDRFAANHRLMAAALAPRSVNIAPGGHDWRTWRRLWENFLDVQL